MCLPSLHNALNLTELLRDVLCSPLEESVSQNFDLGPVFFMLCRKLVKAFF